MERPHSSDALSDEARKVLFGRVGRTAGVKTCSRSRRPPGRNRLGVGDAGNSTAMI